jgi:NADH-quinone oxidoreductase subunit N
VVLRELVAADVTWLAVVAVALSVIGLFYYLRVVRVMYFERDEKPVPVDAGSEMRIMISTNALAILALGIYPGGLLALCVSALGY